MVQTDKQHDNVICRMRFACWLGRAMDTQSR
jgi:hypothetical protein